MPDTEIEVREEGGSVLVSAHDEAEMEHRWWFDPTEAGRLVFVSEVIHYEDDSRHYVEEHEAVVPDPVHDALEAEGYDEVVDTSGFPL